MPQQAKSTVLIAAISAVSAVAVALITTYGTIAVSAPEAIKVKEELRSISDLQLIRNLPIGSIVPSMLPPSRFAQAVGDPDPSVFDPGQSRWALADGRDVTISRYGQLSGQGNAPDLRGMFLRGMNVDGGADPDPGRKAGDVQKDALREHGHATDARAHGWGEQGDRQGWTKRAGEAPPASVTRVTGAATAVETRPVNVAVYFYIKIN